MTLFPSTRTDYLVMNERYKPLADVHVRRAISIAIDRKAIVKSVLFGHGKPANSFMPPQVPFYDPNSPGLQYNMAKAKEELAQSKYPEGLQGGDAASASGVADENAIGQILQQALKKLGITVVLKPVDPSIEFHGRAAVQVPARLQLLDDGHRRPGRARDVRGRPERRARNSFFTDYNNPTVIELVAPGRARPFSAAAPAALQRRSRRSAAQDAFMAFLYYSPFRYAYSSKVHGFFVYPLGNYHLEDVWLSH